MSNNNTIYSTQPIGSRPPFATDEDHLYEENSQPTRRVRQPAPEDPNDRTSAYDMYNQYIDEKHGSDMGAVGNSMLANEDPFDDSNQPRQKPKPAPIPLAAPRPGYAAPVAALNLASPTSPSRAASPAGRSPSPSHPRPLMLVESMNSPVSPRMPSPGVNVPATPHPLPPTITPIQPVFARPAKNADERDIKFASQPILRGEKEETLLPRRGEKGDDFWRRFSMVVHQEGSTQKESAWLRKTQNGSTRLSRWVWVIGLLLLLCIAGGIGLGVFISSKDKTHNAPKAIGGSANEKLQTESTTKAPEEGVEASTAYHVSPTRTVARRDVYPEPTAIAALIPSSPSSFADAHLVRPVPPSRHRRAHLNRTGV